MKNASWGLSLMVVTLVAAEARAETYYVDDAGDDDAAGSSAAPWATLQQAADAVAPGDVVIVRPGSYAGFHLDTSGTASAPITFRAEPGAIVDRDNETTPDGINLEGASFVVIEGFEVTDASRAGIRAVECEHVTIRGNRAHDNFRWGIFTGFCDDLLIEDNEGSGSEDEHGIYVSNSGDRPVVRGNRLFGNNANGLHMNGDESAGGDGVISDALVEDNVIYDNGGGGGSGINCDGVQDSVIRNNLIYDAHASGISLYRIDGAEGSTNNLVINNTVVVANDGRWAMNIQDASTGNRLLNNVFLTEHGFRGAVDISSDSLPGLESDHNVVVGRFTTNGGDDVLSLAEWRTASGQDASSIEATIAEVFADAGADDFHLAGDSPALDIGESIDAPPTDFEGDARPIGAGVDVGADERCESDCAPVAVDGGVVDVDAGASSDAGSADGGTSSDDGGAPGDPDAGVVTADDAGRPLDAGEGGEEDGGCGCRAVGRGPDAPIALLALFGLLGLRRRSRRG